ncbi:MAG: hypothetical protein Fur0032_01890 [Terrimicrobiaceae bacterium]
MTPRLPVSVIIPAHNSAEHLPAVLAACRSQTLPPAEIIVVDDGSRDATSDICRDCAPEARLVRIENGGVARARNIGARHASGEAFVFLDADDILLPHALETLASRLAGTHAGVAYGMVIDRREPPTPPRLSGFDFVAGEPPLPAERNFWRCGIITPGSAIVRADLHREVGGFVTGYEPLEDRDYWIKCGLLRSVAFCDTVVLDKTWRPSSHGSQHAKRIYRGQLAQRRLAAWCQSHGVPADWIPQEREILRRALNEACWRGCEEIIPALRREASSVGLFHWRSLPALISRPAEPDWLGDEPRVLES